MGWKKKQGRAGLLIKYNITCFEHIARPYVWYGLCQITCHWDWGVCQFKQFLVRLKAIQCVQFWYASVCTLVYSKSIISSRLDLLRAAAHKNWNGYMSFGNFCNCLINFLYTIRVWSGSQVDGVDAIMLWSGNFF